jgi:hypothetical protein
VRNTQKRWGLALATALTLIVGAAGTVLAADVPIADGEIEEGDDLFSAVGDPAAT